MHELLTGSLSEGSAVLPNLAAQVVEGVLILAQAIVALVSVAVGRYCVV